VIRTKARDCGGKIPHAGREEAEAHRQRLIRNGAAAHRLKVYRCPADKSHFHCGHVHPGKR
jgi:hypothetical protein